MLETQLKALVDHIKTRITLFGDNGFFVNVYKDNADDFQGVDDSKQNYFFVQQAPSDKANEYFFDKVIDTCDSYEVETDCLFVAGLQCPILDTAIVALASALHTFDAFNVTIDNVSTNSENIYKELYGENYQREEQLILIKFKVKYLFQAFEYCDNDFCGDCCD